MTLRWERYKQKTQGDRYKLKHPNEPRTIRKACERTVTKISKQDKRGRGQGKEGGGGGGERERDRDREGGEREREERERQRDTEREKRSKALTLTRVKSHFHLTDPAGVDSTALSMPGNRHNAKEPWSFAPSG